jgi:hypothetical protein
LKRFFNRKSTIERRKRKKERPSLSFERNGR